MKLLVSIALCFAVGTAVNPAAIVFKSKNDPLNNCTLSGSETDELSLESTCDVMVGAASVLGNAGRLHDQGKQIAKVEADVVAMTKYQAGLNRLLANETAALRKLIEDLTARVAKNEKDHGSDAQALLDAKAEFNAADDRLQSKIKEVADFKAVPGPKGEPGERGSDGSDGAKGERGDDGSDGAKGERGDDGRQGVDGKAGAKGQKGERGPGPTPSPTRHPTPFPTPAPTPSEHTCAWEGGGCHCSGCVYYSRANSVRGMISTGRWSMRRANGHIGCNNGVFGDPWGGTRKNCICESPCTR